MVEQPGAWRCTYAAPPAGQKRGGGQTQMARDSRDIISQDKKMMQLA